MGLRQPEMVPVDLNPDLNPLVGKMASRLAKSFGQDSAVRVEDRWALITEVLGFAAEAEQKLTEQRQRISQLESLTMTDELTGVGNRRGLEDFLRRALANASRHGETGVLAFLDLDNFKAINDRFGHEVGDFALRKTAHILTANTRVSDYVARVGGDEFVVVLTHCPAREGRKRLKQLRNMLDDAILRPDDVAISLKASIGVASYESGSQMEVLLHTADALMYSEKLERKQETEAVRRAIAS